MWSCYPAVVLNVGLYLYLMRQSGSEVSQIVCWWWVYPCLRMGPQVRKPHLEEPRWPEMHDSQWAATGERQLNRLREVHITSIKSVNKMKINWKCTPHRHRHEFLADIGMNFWQSCWRKFQAECHSNQSASPDSFKFEFPEFPRLSHSGLHTGEHIHWRLLFSGVIVSVLCFSPVIWIHLN